MSELFDKSIRTLELPRVLQLLSEQAVSPEAKELALAVRPETDYEDVLRLLASRSLLERWTPRPEQWVSVTGEVRSYNNKSGAGSRLVITVLARTIQPEAEGEGVNHLRLAGVLCKTPVPRPQHPGADPDRRSAVRRPPGQGVFQCRRGRAYRSRPDFSVHPRQPVLGG